MDFRSDQFTLGAILYEMATGQKAFQRKTGAETLVAIIREEPQPISQLAPKAPAPVRWIVERCLAKDPEERYASTKDLARDLKSLRDHLTETSASGALEAGEPAKASRRGWLAPAIVALALGIGIGFAARNLAAGRPAAREKFQPLTFQRGAILNARFAPDGQTVVYSAAWEGRPLELFSTRTDSTESRSLGLPPGDVLSISSSGEMLVSLGRHYVSGYESTGTLARVSLGGGAPKPLLEEGRGRGLGAGREDARGHAARRQPQPPRIPAGQGPLRGAGMGQQRSVLAGWRVTSRSSTIPAPQTTTDT